MAAPTEEPPTDTATSFPPNFARRPLQREGACYLPSAAERAMEAERVMEAAMMRSSSPLVETALGKRVHEGNDLEDDDAAESDGEGPPPVEATAPHALPLLSNLIAATLRYASRKKLRPEQCDEIEGFLSVSTLLYHWHCATQNIG